MTTQGSNYPLAGIKVGGAPAHRLATPPKSGSTSPTSARTDSSAAAPAEKAVEAATTEKSAEAATPTEKASATTPAPATSSVTDSATPRADRRRPEKPATESNEVEVTTSDQISEHGLPTNGRSTSHGSTGSTPTLGRGQAPDRRTAMGVASVRIAGRLTQNELGSRTGDIRTPDTSVGPDELLQLLGEYLVSGGLQNPEIHVRSNGQTIVLDLQNPAKGYR
ncbi:hypothetical protein CH294_02480 [Rhodococcus sp. 14-2483-1-1]|uniref:hypothetical protein n=1 Tax=Rhodococcus sp. 15-649-2-2 TaxID=2023140 RepID=UPI00050C2098|nr:hypothetical protein [Rhodococcus sp. 15-649-2-2]OZC52721.1 hypothetical protein CH286_02895 [Rhodococcus sp. WWJCD1]OZE87983.1 hypothetical protein CH305_01870 [Rhodococcus sp. 15-649-2-2]OZF41213.1 hypothetical protein CH294_02480 [Rhodococcus sp. 14-2483-1-1]